MAVGRQWRVQAPAGGVGELSAPEFFQNGGVWRTGLGAVVGQHHAFERKRRGSQCLGEAERQRTARENFAGGVARAGGVGSDKLQLGGVKRARGIPEPGGPAFGQDFQLVVPGPGADGAECSQPFLIEIEEDAGRVSEAVKLHGRQAES